MTLPHARKLTVDAREYSYILKRLHKPHRTGDSPGRMKLVVDRGNNDIVTTCFRSKAWTVDHEEGHAEAPAHKVGFLPSDVIAVIRALAFNAGTLPENFDLPEWRRFEVKKSTGPTRVIGRAPSRRSVGVHLDLGDLRALVFEEPSETTDFHRAKAHMASCAMCRGLVERERAENPLLQSAG